VPRTIAARLPVVAIVAPSRGRSPLKVLFAPLVATFDALPGAVNGDIRRRFLVTAQCHLPASLCRVKHDLLIAGSALCGDATQLLKHAPKEVIMSALLQALCAAFGLRACATLASLVANLRFTVPSLPLPWRGLG
jgi:hypothetical protein